MGNQIVYCARCGQVDTLKLAKRRTFHTNRSACCNEELCIRRPKSPSQKLQNAATAQELISIHQAGQRGIERLRKPIWANPLDHLKIDLVKGGVGPWLHIYAPFNKECNGRDPVNMIGLLSWGAGCYDSQEFVPYTGPLADSDEYKSAAAKYDGCMKDTRRSSAVSASAEQT